MKVNILGQRYEIKELSSDKDARLKECDGYCDWTVHLIVICREEDGNILNMEEYVKKVKRHEILHAFMFESGLAHSSLAADSWATNEEMIDWFAFNGAKVYEAWRSVGAV